MAELAPRPALLFDGRCGFCTWTAEWLLRHRRRDVRIVPWQQADLAAYGLDELRARSAAWWIDEEGALSRGHRAIGQALRACGGAWPVLGRLILTPPFSWFAATVPIRPVSRCRTRAPLLNMVLFSNETGL